MANEKSEKRVASRQEMLKRRNSDIYKEYKKLYNHLDVRGRRIYTTGYIVGELSYKFYLGEKMLDKIN